MTIHVWRIVKAKHAADAFPGEGAKAVGGRWNSPGAAVVYTAGSTSLAMLEMLVHLGTEQLLQRYVLVEASFDEALMTSVTRRDLPGTWRKSPPPRAIQQIGDAWLKGQRSAVLRVPSVVVPTEWNHLLNPLHPDFAQIAIGPQKSIEFDPRLVKR